MAPVANGRVLFNEIPEGFPVIGKTLVLDESQQIDVENVPLNGGILIKLLYASVDPYMRGRMRDPSRKSYSPAFKLGESINGYALGIVVRSENAKAKEGDHIYGMLEYQNYIIRPNTDGLRIIDNKANAPLSSYIGVLGMPGKTAYMAWKEYSQAKKGEVAYVSTGAGPVGSFVIQLAKRQGLKVIASAGSDEKVEFMKSIGADVAFNYKNEKILDVLNREGPIDIFWDNVGGETLEAALEAANLNARFIECGMISGYNTGGAPVRNLFHVISKSISMHGFIVSRLEEKYADAFYEEVPQWVASGELKYTEQVWEGLKNVEEAILAVQKGTNKAKAVVKV